MTEITSPFTVRTTERLELRAVTMDDLDALHEINRDPEVWRHQPEGRHTTPVQTRDWIERAIARWVDREDGTPGLSYWTARRTGSPEVIGIGGVQEQGRGYFNLYYRLARPQWGNGYATELARAALAAAREHSPDVPVYAWVHGHNAESNALARRLGMVEHGLRHDPFKRELANLYTDRELVFQG